MNIATKLPTMEDDALAILYLNAERLMQSGTTAQQTAATALMPAVKAELAARSAAKLSKIKAKTASGKRAVKAKIAAATE